MPSGLIWAKWWPLAFSIHLPVPLSPLACFIPVSGASVPAHGNSEGYCLPLCFTATAQVTLHSIYFLPKGSNVKLTKYTPPSPSNTLLSESHFLSNQKKYAFLITTLSIGKENHFKKSGFTNTFSDS